MSWRMMMMNPLMRVCPGCSTLCLPSQRSCWDQPVLSCQGENGDFCLNDDHGWVLTVENLPGAWQSWHISTWQDIDFNWLYVTPTSLLWSSFLNLKLRLVSDGRHLSSFNTATGFWKNCVLSILPGWPCITNHFLSHLSFMTHKMYLEVLDWFEMH